MLTKRINEKHYEFTYSYYEYDTPQTLSVEYARYKCYKKLTKHFMNAFDIKEGEYINFLQPLILYGISKNQNINDPVLLNFTSEAFIENFKKNKDIKLEEEEVKVKIRNLNNKVEKYINKLKTIEDVRILNKESEDDKILLEIKDRGNTRIILSKFLYNKICDRYRQHNQNNFNTEIVDKLIWSVLFRHKYLGLLESWQGSISPIEIEYIRSKYNVDVELFGSMINVTLKYYGSMFPDIEKYFGSIGNFFNCNLIRGFFQMNPPTILWMLESSFKRIREMLDMTTDLTVFTSTGVWDIYDRQKLNKYCNTNKATDYPNPKLDTLKRTKYIVIDRLYCQNVYKYHDYIGTKRNINTLQINIIVVSNKYKKGEIQLDFLPDNYIEN